MLSYSEQRKLPYTPEQLFDLIIAVDKYPGFIPWCKAARITKTGDGFIEADLVVSYKVFQEKFTSLVTYDRPHTITVEYQKGPMKHLENKWTFTPTDDGGCLVDFHVAFEFKSRLYQMVVNQFFEKAVKKMIGAFEKQAEKLYGGVSPRSLRQGKYDPKK